MSMSRRPTGKSPGTVISQYNGALSSGSGDPEELLPQFLEALDDAGIDDVIAAKQEQLDAFLAEK